MDIHVIIYCLLIILARIADVSLGTLRTLFIVHGRRGVAFICSFFEVLIWIIVVSKVIANLKQPLYAVSYAFGFALGTYVGMTVEGWLGKGQQVIRMFTRKGEQVVSGLRGKGFVVTQFEGTGKEGPISMLFLETQRRNVAQIVQFITSEDPDCFYIIDNVKLSSGKRVRYYTPTGWRAIFKKK